MKGRARNARALEVVRELIGGRPHALDALEHPRWAGEWDDELTSAKRDMDLSRPSTPVAS